MLRFVDATKLNFRSQAEIGDNVVASLHLGQAVDVTGAASGGFVKATVKLGDRIHEGFLSEKFLRDPVSDEREALLQQALVEWRRFNFGLGQEHQDPYFKFVGEMWKAIGIDLDGKDRGVPWSAAAISFMVRKAGETFPESKYSNFKFAAAHSRFVHDSIRRREKGDKTSPFWGFDLHERRPELGDIVCRGFGSSRPDFEFAAKHDAFRSHSDIIVRLMDESVLAVGGNVSNSVKVTEYALTADGFLDDAKKVYALLANQH